MPRVKKICTECGKDYIGTAKSEVCSGACRVRKMRRLQKEVKEKKPKRKSIIKKKEIIKKVVIKPIIKKSSLLKEELVKYEPKIPPRPERKLPPPGLSKTESMKWFRENSIK